jgi:hypothetical protein
MTEKERKALREKIDATVARNEGWIKSLGETVSKLPPDVPIANGPVNQKQLQAMLKDLKDSESETED